MLSPEFCRCSGHPNLLYSARPASQRAKGCQARTTKTGIAERVTTSAA